MKSPTPDDREAGPEARAASNEAPHDVKQDESFQKELEQLINKYSKENGSNTPDFILADYIRDCLIVFDVAARRRDVWYGLELSPGSVKVTRV